MARGRLLKKADQEKLGISQVESYPWKDFSPETTLLPDNPRKSVVLAKSHPSQELNKKVQTPPEFSRTFGQPSKPIYPTDMTNEFFASQEDLRQRKRRMQMDESEAVQLELLDLDEEEEFERRSFSQVDTEGDDGISVAQELSRGAASTAPKTRSSSPDISSLSSLTSHNSKGLDARELDFSVNENAREKFDAELKESFARGLAQGRQEGEQLGYERALAESTAAVRNNENRDTVQQPADHLQSQAQSENAEAIAVGPSYEEGLAEGRAQGHAEALKEAEHSYNHSMSLFTKALSELQHLKGELLSTGRDIFAEIAQICADKILRRHIQWNDEALRQVFTAAMGQFQSQDDLKIEMHPEDVARIEQQIPEEQRTRLRLLGNAKLDRGDIKIEANNEVVSFDIQKTVAGVIDSLKDELFDDNKKTSNTEKAG